MLRSTLREDVEKELEKYDKADDVQCEIHPEVNFRYNTVNVLLGQRGSGKSFNGFFEVAAISRVPNLYHEFVFVCNNPNDRTFVKMRNQIDMPASLVPYDESEEYLEEIVEYKQAYDEVKDKHLENLLTDESKKDICEHLKIRNFNKPSLHTVILYDDALEVFKKPNSKEYKLLMENRHPKFTYILNIQDWKGISNGLKSNIDSVWIFGGYPRDRFVYFYGQIRCPVDRERVYEIYKTLGKRQALIFDNYDDGVTIKLLEENGQTRILFSNR